MPQISTWPSVGAKLPVSIRMVVDLPAPFGPKKPNTSPFDNSNETLLTALFGPNNLVNPNAFNVVAIISFNFNSA